MPPKHSTGKEKATQKDLEEEEPLQAVVLADSFDNRFKPLTLNTPRCLLPVCNAPLLDWTFEALALAGVAEIFVVCRSHADRVKAAIAYVSLSLQILHSLPPLPPSAPNLKSRINELHILMCITSIYRDSKWSRPSSGLKIVPVVTAQDCFSTGDAMREIYTHGFLKADFVLVAGDLVSNVRLDEVVSAHRARRKANRDAIMTMVVKEAGARHRTRWVRCSLLVLYACSVLC